MASIRETEGVVPPIRHPGEIDIILRAGIPPASPVMHALRDLRRDWRRWSAAERRCAAALSGLWVLGIAAAIAANAHLL